MSHFTAHCPLLKPNVIILVTHIAQNITIWALQDDLQQYKSKNEILWFYAEIKSIKLTQQKFKEHFNVAQAPRNQLSWA